MKDRYEAHSTSAVLPNSIEEGDRRIARRPPGAAGRPSTELEHKGNVR